MSLAYINDFEKILKKLYRVRVPYMSTLSEYEIRSYQHNTTKVNGKEVIDNTMVLVMIPIINMVEKFKNGDMIRIIDKNDINDIVSTIDAHIAYATDTSISLSRNRKPDQLLIDLDDFSKSIFDTNKRYIVDTDVNDVDEYEFGVKRKDGTKKRAKKPPTVTGIDYDSITRAIGDTPLPRFTKKNVRRKRGI